MMRLLSVLMSKTQPDNEGSVRSEIIDRPTEKPAFSSISSHTAHILTQEKIVELCYHILQYVKCISISGLFCAPHKLPEENLLNL